MPTTTESPFFIVGVHRSGTTLLRYMLGSSPRIYIPPESDFIPYFFQKSPTAEMAPHRAAEIIATIFSRYRFVGEWQGDPPEIASLLPEGPACTPAAFLSALYATYAQQQGAVRWGDKTPIYASYMDLIHDIFPQAQFIHLIRDGRDVALSMLDKWGEGEFHIDLYYAARSWVRRIRQAQASGSRLGSSLYYELRYEDLVRDPEVALEPLCAFLAEPYLPQMAQPHHLGRKRIQEGEFHEPIRQPPSTARVGRWRQAMSVADQRLFHRVAGDLLAKLGYDAPDPGPMPLQETGRLALLGSKYASLQAGRRVLQTIGLYPPN